MIMKDKMLESFQSWNDRNKRQKIKEILPLSYSQLTDFAFNRSGWALRRIFGFKFPTSAAAERGSAIESGLSILLNGKSMAQAQKGMLYQFDENVKNLIDPNIQSERALLKNMLIYSWVEIDKKNWKLLDYQKKVETEISGIPVIGYTDFHFEDTETKQDFYIDLKTSKRMPSEVSLSYAMQQAIYAKATNAEQRLIYVIGYKNKEPVIVDDLKVNDYSQYIKIAEHIVNVMGDFLYRNKTPENIKNAIVPDPEHWWWKYPKGDLVKIEARKHIWGY